MGRERFCDQSGAGTAFTSQSLQLLLDGQSGGPGTRLGEEVLSLIFLFLHFPLSELTVGRGVLKGQERGVPEMARSPPLCFGKGVLK